MASGDPQRVWFPEMLEELKRTWTTSTSWDELAVFCQRMTEKRSAIRQARGIRSPRFRCPKCDKVGRSDVTGVSIRSALFALKKLGIVGEVELKALDRDWKKHKRKNGLDAYGSIAKAKKDQHV